MSKNAVYYSGWFYHNPRILVLFLVIIAIGLTSLAAVNIFIFGFKDWIPFLIVFVFMLIVLGYGIYTAVRPSSVAGWTRNWSMRVFEEQKDVQERIEKVFAMKDWKFEVLEKQNLPKYWKRTKVAFLIKGADLHLWFQDMTFQRKGAYSLSPGITRLILGRETEANREQLRNVRRAILAEYDMQHKELTQE